MKQHRFFSGWGMGLGKASILGLAVTLAACGSSVKLNEAPVQDRPGVFISRGEPQPGGDDGANSRSVSQVDAGQRSMSALPAELQRVIYFDFDSYEVRSEYAPLLEAQARFLAGNRQLRLGLEGHTDERGGREYNLALGQKRAEAVRRSLAILGVDDNQLEAVSFGKEKPAALGSSEDSHARNRRVEFQLR